MPNGARSSPGPRCTNSGGVAHGGASAPSTVGPRPPPPNPCGGGPPARAPAAAPCPAPAPPCRGGAPAAGPAEGAPPGLLAGAGGVFGFVSGPEHPGGTTGAGGAPP